MNQQNVIPPTNIPPTLASTPVAPITQVASQEISYLEKAAEIIVNPITRRVVAIGLTAQGLFGVFTSLKFVLVEFPLLEAKLASHSIQASEVNSVAVEAMIVIISTVLSMFFALKITVMQNKAAKALNTIIAVLLFLGNALVFRFLSNLPLIEIWDQLVNNLLTFKTNLLKIFK